MTRISNNPSAPPSCGSLSSNRFWIVFGVLACLSFTLYFALPQYALDTWGRRTTGILTNVFRSAHGAFFVDYRYQVGAQTFNDHCGIQEGDFHGNQVGGPVTVTYLPDHPNVSRTEPSNIASFAYPAFWVVVVGGSIAFVLLGIDFMKRRSGQTKPPSA